MLFTLSKCSIVEIASWSLRVEHSCFDLAYQVRIGPKSSAEAALSKVVSVCGSSLNDRLRLLTLLIAGDTTTTIVGLGASPDQYNQLSHSRSR